MTVLQGSQGSSSPITSGWGGDCGGSWLFKPLSIQGRPTLGWELLAGELRALGQERPPVPPHPGLDSWPSGDTLQT